MEVLKILFIINFLVAISDLIFAYGYAFLIQEDFKKEETDFSDKKKKFQFLSFLKNVLRASIPIYNLILLLGFVFCNYNDIKKRVIEKVKEDAE